ncbi:hypothetical protein L7F22_035427 [Adiantum nelumboides]|nr:hypothetical protein [Adiantum nelumboides]
MKRDLPKDRPPPLKISRPSDPHHHQQHPHHHHHQQQQQQAPQPHHLSIRQGHPSHHRQPVIIHTYSPEVIQIESENFRQLVQRLTGPAGSHTPPPPKRARVTAPPHAGNFNVNYGDSASQFEPSSSNQAQLPPRSVLSPRGLRLQQEAPHPYAEAAVASRYLPHNPLLSPSLFDFSPSVLPSPSTFSFDFPSLTSPLGTRGGTGGLLPSPLAPGVSGPPLPSPLGHGGAPTPRSLAAALPSPGPLSSAFLADLPVLSPAAYSWIEKNASTADAILGSRPLISAGLPPRPPPTTTANLFPRGPAEDEKPFLYRDER